MVNTSTAADITHIEERIRAAYEQLKEAEQKLENAERQYLAADRHAGQCREARQRRRIELGRLFLKARPQWPERGPNAKGWGEFLKRLGIHEQSAREWMDLANEIDISKPEDGGLEMKRVEVQANKKAREEGFDPELDTAPTKPQVYRRLDHDACVRQLRRAIKWMVDGGHSPSSLAEALGDWTTYSEEDRRAIGADVAAELRALAAAVEQL
jgi:hypothetical protein